MDVHRAAKIHAVLVKCSELLTDGSRTYKVRSQVWDINFQEVKANCVSYRHCLVFVVFVCLECKLDKHIWFGEAGVAVSRLRGTMFLSLKKSSTVSLNNRAEYCKQNFSMSNSHQLRTIRKVPLCFRANRLRGSIKRFGLFYLPNWKTCAVLCCRWRHV